MKKDNCSLALRRGGEYRMDKRWFVKE